MKTREEFIKESPSKKSALLDMHIKHYEDRRLEKLKILLEERESIKREEGQGYGPYSPGKDGNRNNLSGKGSKLSAGPSSVMGQGKSKN